ncbi:putative deacetylase [Bacillus sp. TS-2]|nr:putative deacetylase [Bacillus sp. TS-2]
MKRLVLFLICLGLFLLAGCFSRHADAPEPITPNIEIPKLNQEVRAPIEQIITTKKQMALTFNGLADEQTMDQLLEKLNTLQIKATFFLNGHAVAENPELAQRILDQGSTIQNNTLNHVMAEGLDYETAFLEMKLANQVLKEKINIEPTYVRSRSNETSLEFEEAATLLNMEVVTSTINPRDSQMQSAEEIAEYVKRFSKRGSIISLNTYLNPEIIDAIELIYHDAVESGYELTTLEKMELGSYMKSESVETNSLTLNSNEAVPTIIKRFETNEKEIALTFDDWASDETLEAILDILDEYQVKSTFFLIGKGVEASPQLARLIIDRGHEVASHSYHHQVITEMEIEDLKEDLVLNDQILTNALQEKPLNYFRPAQGLIDEETANAIAATGIEYIVLYDVASLDWDLSRTEEEIIERITTRAEPGSIVGLHILDEAHTVSILPQVIEYFQNEGYQMRRISEMMNDDREVTEVLYDH